MSKPTLPSGAAALQAKVDVTEDRVLVTTWDVTVESGDLNLRFQAGATFSLRVEWTDGEGNPRDMGAYTAAAEVRKHPDDVAAVATLTAVIAGDIITLSATAAQTAAWDFTRATYDLKLTTGTTVTRLLSGTADLSKQVTR